MEVYKTIKGYEGIYEVSNSKDVRRCSSKRILKPKKNGEVILYKKGRAKTFSKNQLYKMAFEGYVIDNNRLRVLVQNGDNVIEISTRQMVQMSKFTKNKTSKFTGVSKRKGKFEACIFINGKNRHLGIYDNENEAGNVYKLAVNNLHLYKGNAKDFRIILKSFFD
jgi:hypothetical protein